ncbi:MAG: ThuA domain-containing protein [Thermoguttaceae bacterium]|nr:ThuA domain-containing protein [Thermoguttaceae bacterium]
MKNVIVFIFSFVVAISAVFYLSVGSTCFGAENAPIRALVLDGGHGYDEPAFAQMLAELGDEFVFTRARLPEARGMLKPGLGRDFDVVLFYDMCQVPATDSEFEAFKTLLASGEIGAFFWHHHIGAHPERQDFWRLSGGAYVVEQNAEIEGVRRPISDYEHDIKIDVVPATPDDAPFPIEKFSIIDEGYLNVFVAPEAKILLKTDSPKASPEIAWTWKYGEREVLVCLLGHDVKAYRNEKFRDFLRRGLKWLATNAK